MIGDLLLRLNTLLSRYKTVFFLSLLFIIAVLGFGISRLKITESIFATLPKGKSFEEFNRLIENKSIINQIVFSININPETDTDEAGILAETFADSLNNLELKATVAKANQAMGNLNEITRKINAGEGTLGALVTDKTMYTNLNKALNSFDSLMVDLKYNPHHYFAPLGKKPKKK